MIIVLTSFNLYDRLMITKKGGKKWTKKGIRQDGGDTPKMRTCHCERSEAISKGIALSLIFLKNYIF